MEDARPYFLLTFSHGHLICSFFLIFLPILGSLSLTHFHLSDRSNFFRYCCPGNYVMVQELSCKTAEALWRKNLSCVISAITCFRAICTGSKKPLFTAES